MSGTTQVWECGTEGLEAVRAFRRHAERQPEAIAIEFGGHSTSYGALLNYVDSISSRLDSCDSKIALAIHGTPSVDFIASMLAGWARNKVVLPIDSRLPPLRKSWMANLGYVAMIIQTDTTPLDFVSSKPVWSLSDQTPPSPCFSMDFGTDRHDASYIFYTSGSTGNPKPVLGRAASLDHFLRWQTSRFQFTTADRICLTTSPSFDPFLRELLSTLSTGGTLLVPEPRDRQDPELTAVYLKQAMPTIIHAVPTLAGHWLRAFRQKGVTMEEVRLSFFAGEPLSGDLVRAWRQICPNSEIVNLYGPTETTLAKFYSVVPADCEASPSLPVGKSIPNTCAVILGPDGCAVDQGEQGEVWIDTAFASYGYLGDEVAKDPPANVKPLHGEALHFTGDLGYLNLRGDLVIGGRSDNQIKIGGVKFNPVEVAQALRALPQVQDAFALGVGKDHRKELVAWYVPAAGRSPTEDVLRRQLRESLFPAMLPSRLIALDRLPTNSNGKVDRAVLLENIDSGLGDGSAGDITAECLAGLWSEILEQPSISVDSNFFSLGGDSMSATRLCAAIRRVLGRSCDVADVLDYPTPRQLGRLVCELPLAENSSAKIFTSKQSYGEVAISERQAAYQAVCMATGDETWCILSRSLQISGDVSADVVRQALYEIALKHDALRIIFPHNPDLSRQFFLNDHLLQPEAISVEHYCHRTADGQHMNELITQARARGSSALFSLSDWPLFKAAVLNFADCSTVILWIHHMAVDGPSMNIIFDELRQRLVKSPLTLTVDVPTATYQDYIDSESEVPARRMEIARAYWQGLLKGAHPLVLPETDAPGSTEGRLYTRAFPLELRVQISRFAAACGVTPFVVLLGGYLKAVANRAGREEVLVIIPMQAKSDERFEHTVGLFFTQAVLRLDTSEMTQGRPHWTAAVAKQLADAQRHSCYEFHRRLRDMGVSNDGRHFPLTTVLFNQNRLATGMGFEATTPFGLHRLGRSLRFQLQGEVQVRDDEFLLSYLFRNGTFPDDRIASFANEVEENLESITS